MPSTVRLLSCGFLLALGWCAFLPHAGLAADAEIENWNRLRSMPREQRLALWEKIRQFDALGPAEKTAIRALDARIAKLPAAEQENYWSVLRRYHHWVEGLSEEQRNELKTVPAADRMRLVTKLRAQERSTSSTSTIPLFLQVIDFAAMSPFETAQRLKAWFDLTSLQRAEIEEIASPADQQKRLNELSQHVRLSPVSRIGKVEEDALLAKLDTNPQLKNWLSNPLKKGDSAKHEKVKRRIAANYYFLEKPPASVDPSRLLRFEAGLPPWYRGQSDHLPPEEARRRLTILYRLVYPAPTEMPDIPKAPTTQATAPAPRSGTSRSAPPTPSRPGPVPGPNPF